jgi:deazaflavin-dependent oxidoreductase (nitroreductase family)
MTDNTEYAPSPEARERAQVDLYEATDGAAGNTLYGSPVVILTHRGARSGLLRKAPLMRVERNGVYAVIASNGGADRDPLWVHNLDEQPEVVIQDLAEKYTLTARRADGEERERWWKGAYSVLPRFADYRAGTDRDIPVFLLESPAG